MRVSGGAINIQANNATVIMTNSRPNFISLLMGSVWIMDPKDILFI